jgi:hypothetical protein
MSSRWRVLLRLARFSEIVLLLTPILSACSTVQYVTPPTSAAQDATPTAKLTMTVNEPGQPTHVENAVSSTAMTVPRGTHIVLSASGSNPGRGVKEVRLVISRDNVTSSDIDLLSKPDGNGKYPDFLAITGTAGSGGNAIEVVPDELAPTKGTVTAFNFTGGSGTITVSLTASTGSPGSGGTSPPKGGTPPTTPALTFSCKPPSSGRIDFQDVKGTGFPPGQVMIEPLIEGTYNIPGFGPKICGDNLTSPTKFGPFTVDASGKVDASGVYVSFNCQSTCTVTLKATFGSTAIRASSPPCPCQ